MLFEEYLHVPLCTNHLPMLKQTPSSVQLTDRKLDGPHKPAGRRDPSTPSCGAGELQVQDEQWDGSWSEKTVHLRE